MPIPIIEPSERETAVRIRRRIEAVEYVKKCEEVRMTHSRKKPFVHVHVLLKDNPGYEQTHRISSIIEKQIRTEISNARIAIRSEPETGEGREIWNLVRRISEEEPRSRGAHSIHVQKLGSKLGIDFHLEVSSGLNVRDAHAVSSSIERKIRASEPKITEVVIHEESVSDLVSSERSGHGTEVKWYLEHVSKRFPDVRLVGSPVIREMGNQLHVILRTAFNADMSLGKANEITSMFEAAIRDGNPAIVRVDIIQEPFQRVSRSS